MELEAEAARAKLALAKAAIRAARDVQREMDELRVYAAQQERIVALLTEEIQRKGAKTVDELHTMHSALVASLDREAQGALELEVLRAAGLRDRALTRESEATARSKLSTQRRALAAVTAREEAASAKLRIVQLQSLDDIALAKRSVLLGNGNGAVNGNRNSGAGAVEDNTALTQSYQGDGSEEVAKSLAAVQAKAEKKLLREAAVDAHTEHLAALEQDHAMELTLQKQSAAEAVLSSKALAQLHADEIEVARETAPSHVAATEERHAEERSADTAESETIAADSAAKVLESQTKVERQRIKIEAAAAEAKSSRVEHADALDKHAKVVSAAKEGKKKRKSEKKKKKKTPTTSNASAVPSLSAKIISDLERWRCDYSPLHPLAKANPKGVCVRTSAGGKKKTDGMIMIAPSDIVTVFESKLVKARNQAGQNAPPETRWLRILSTTAARKAKTQTVTAADCVGWVPVKTSAALPKTLFRKEGAKVVIATGDTTTMTTKTTGGGAAAPQSSLGHGHTAGEEAMRKQEKQPRLGTRTAAADVAAAATTNTSIGSFFEDDTAAEGEVITEKRTQESPQDPSSLGPDGTALPSLGPGGKTLPTIDEANTGSAAVVKASAGAGAGVVADAGAEGNLSFLVEGLHKSVTRGKRFFDR